MSDTTPEAMIEFDRVSIVFGDDPDRALPLMDKGKSRPDIQKATGQILGVHDCSLSVAPGEISVLMISSSTLAASTFASFFCCAAGRSAKLRSAGRSAVAAAS